MELTQVSHYRILEKLGAGGMGEVYLAEDMRLGRKVAIKILSEEYTTSKDRLNRFEQEASAASALNHPNILTIYEVGNDDGRHYIATEYIDGTTLRRKIAAHRLETIEILDIAVQVASALEEAHAAGIIHRDIKPDNVMVRRNGYVKVLDFGLAKLTETSIDRTPSDGEAATRVMVHTDAGVIMGTSHYMSPEQARGKPVDARSDIWSLGVVLYEMVAGRTPFEGETATDVIVAITQKEPAPLARFAPDVPAELEWIIMKALRKARDERYQTVKELLTDLKRLKQKQEFQVELERSSAPDSAATRSTFVPVPGANTVTGTVTPTVEKTVSQVSSAEYIVSEIKRHRVGVAVVAGIFIVGVLAAIFLYFNRAEALTDKDTVLIADFVNTTGDPVFDGTLKQALSVQLAQSPFLNVFPEERLRETLAYMGKPQDERVTREIGREILQRQGLKAMLVGSISSLGSHYVITLEAIAQNGESIAREQAEAESKEKVLTSLSSAASSLRQKLGESLSSIQKYGVAIDQATTSSLEALKAYAMGDEARARGRARESLVFYQRAVELDPNFAMAYARIGVFHGNQGQQELATEYVRKAYELRERVSERERLYITEKYYGYIAGDILKTIETLQTWARIYPNDYVPHNNLALQYLFLARHEESLKEAQEALRLRPNYPASKQNQIGALLGLGRLDEAELATKELMTAHPDSGDAHLMKYVFAFLHGDRAGMDAELAWSRGKGEEADMLTNAALTSFYFGQLKQGEEQIRRANALFTQQNRKENVTRSLLTLATAQAMVGRCAEANANIKRSLEFSRGRFSLLNSALVMAQCNDVGPAQSLLDESTRKFPQDTITVVLVGPVIRSLIEKSKGNQGEALKLLETVRGYDFGLIAGSFNTYFRGQCFLDLKRGSEALAEFEQILKRPGASVFDTTRALSHLGVARAAALGGDLSRSRKMYQDFLALWKDADPDLPVLIEAKKEYDLLK